jgi:DNA-binding beta-propeller fold protein YncE
MEMTLRRTWGLGLGLALVVAFSMEVCAQKTSPPPSGAPLVLTGAIPLPTVKGCIDHFAFDPTHNSLFVSALGNNTEEIIGIGAQTVVHTISGVPTPQGVAYSPQTNKLFVGSDEGKLYVYDGTTFDLITSIDFGMTWTTFGMMRRTGDCMWATGTKRQVQSESSMPRPTSAWTT